MPQRTTSSAEKQSEMSALNRNQRAVILSPELQRTLQWLRGTLVLSRRKGRPPRKAKGSNYAKMMEEEGTRTREEKQSLCQSRFLLFGTGNVLFHVVKCILGDALLENQVL